MRFAQRKLRASLNRNCVLLPTRFAQRKLRASLNGNCVLLPTRFAQRKLRASPNGNCVLRTTRFTQQKLCASPNSLRSTEIVCFAQRASLNANCVLCPTQTPNATFNAITFSSYSYKRISIFTVTIVWTVLHVCHRCHYMSLIYIYQELLICHKQRVSRLYMLGCDTPIFSH